MASGSAGNAKPEVHKKTFLSTVVRNENFALFIILVLLVVTISLVTDGIFLRSKNLMNVLLQSSVRGIITVGMTFVILTAGIDLSVGGVAILVACGGAVLISGKFVGLPLILGIILMLGMGMGVGAINGLSISRLRMSPLIVTLAVWQITEGAAYQVTNRGETILGFPKVLSYLGQGSILGVPVPTIIFIIIAVVGYLILHHTTFGRSVYAVGGNETSAWLSGIQTKRVINSVYLISGLCAAIGGIITISRLMCASVTIIGGLEMDGIAATVIGGVSLMGGKGTIIGAMIGVLIIGVINNGLNIIGVNPAVHSIAKGAVIFLAVAVDVLRRRGSR
jgi:ribose/xylose/arabinose/galactoside ABC-type transport system permease subunit